MIVLETTSEFIDVVELDDDLAVIFVTELTLTSFIFPELGLVLTVEVERVSIGVV